mmetsp:Transcript_27180/g.61948  ORF Transcript_27180/g.61948 Transcript_27180/m.61948 type:complete len:321 (+) Transcript_27180:185-1147(+)
MASKAGAAWKYAFRGGGAALFRHCSSADPSGNRHPRRGPLRVLQLRRGAAQPFRPEERILHQCQVLLRPRRIWRWAPRVNLVLDAHVHVASPSSRELRGPVVADPHRWGVLVAGWPPLSHARPAPRAHGHVHLPGEATGARALRVVARGEVPFRRHGRSARRSSPWRARPSERRATLAIAAVAPRWAGAAAPHGSPTAHCQSIHALRRWRRADANLKTIDEDLAGLECGIGAVRRVLAREAHVHEVLTRDPGVRGLVTVDDLAELRHRPRHADAAVLRHDACGDPHKGRHLERLLSGRGRRGTFERAKRVALSTPPRAEA